MEAILTFVAVIALACVMIIVSWLRRPHPKLRDRRDGEPLGRRLEGAMDERQR